MLCTNCGAEIADGCKFCTQCGQKIENVDSEQQNQAENETPELNPAVEETAAVEAVSEETQAEPEVSEEVAEETPEDPASEGDEPKVKDSTDVAVSEELNDEPSNDEESASEDGTVDDSKLDVVAETLAEDSANEPADKEDDPSHDGASSDSLVQDVAATLPEEPAEDFKAEVEVAEAAAPETTSLTPVSEPKETTETPSEIATTITADGNEVTVLESKRKRNARTITIACTVIICLVVVTLGGLLCWKSLTPKELLLDSSDIKDDAVNTMLVQYDKDGDGKLSEDELGDITELEIGEGVTDLSFLKYLRNLEELIVTNPDIKEIDATGNPLIKVINAPYVIRIILPVKDDYEDMDLTTNDDCDVQPPDDSGCEQQWVPLTVTETVSLAGSDELQNKLTVQDVESRNKINSLSVKKSNDDYTHDWQYDFSYDEYGRLQTTDVTNTYRSDARYTIFNFEKTLGYNSQNKVLSLENKPGYKTSGETSTNYVLYTDDGLVSQVGNSYKVDYNGDKIELKTSSGKKEKTETSWTVSDDKTSTYIEANTDDGYLLEHNYEFDNKANCVTEKFETYSSKNASIEEGEVKGKRTDSVEVKFTYDGSRLIKAEFSNGFVQDYKYDSHGLLVKITSEGEAPTIEGVDITTDCDIVYKRIIAKKNEKPLSFISLPGNNSSSTVNLTSSVREIDPRLTSDLSSSVQDANFTGKFWWDEEGILDRQVEASGKELPQEDDSDEVIYLDNFEPTEVNAAVESKIQEYAKYEDMSQSELSSYMNKSSSDYSVNLYGLREFGTKIYYAYHDLNQDGEDELLISCSSGSDKPSYIVDAFTVKDGEAKRVLGSASSRTAYTLKKDGYLAYHGSSGATNFVDKICKFDGDFSFDEESTYFGEVAKPTCVVEYGSDSTSSSRSSYYKIENEGKKQRLTEKEYKSFKEQIASNYEDETIDWTSVS